LRLIMHRIVRIVLPGILSLASSVAMGSPTSPENFDEAVHFCAEQTGLQAIEYCGRVINVLKDGAPSTRKLLVSVYERRMYLYSIEKNLDDYVARTCADARAMLELNDYLTPERRERAQGLAKLCSEQGH
jgi:hypothetical protein